MKLYKGETSRNMLNSDCITKRMVTYSYLYEVDALHFLLYILGNVRFLIILVLNFIFLEYQLSTFGKTFPVRQVSSSFF